MILFGRIKQANRGIIGYLVQDDNGLKKKVSYEEGKSLKGKIVNAKWISGKGDYVANSGTNVQTLFTDGSCVINNTLQEYLSVCNIIGARLKGL